MKISSVIRPLLFTLTTLTTVTSCGIREDLPPCPPLSVMIGIKDKNYSNIDEVEKIPVSTTGLTRTNLSAHTYRNCIIR